MPVSDAEQPDVLPCEKDPRFECVRIGSTDPHGAAASPPPGGDSESEAGLCPDGYVPRRRRPPYAAEGKRVIRDGPPERNPRPRPD